MSVGVVSGRPRNRVPSDMEAMLWFRTRRGCRARPSARGAGSWNRVALSPVEFAVRAPDDRASSSLSRASSKRWRSWLTR